MDFLYKCYNLTFKLNKFGFTKYLGKALRFFIYFLSNVIANLFYKLRITFYKPIAYTSIPVSLTSFPNRIGKLHLVIYSLLMQSVRPEKIYLWLSVKQFPNLKSDIPKRLLELQKYGLTINFVENDLRSFKKFYHFLDIFGKQTFITVDDDIMYHSEVISFLVDAHNNYPEHVCANKVIQIDNKKSYNNWNSISGSSGVSLSYLPVGCGGVLYPKECFYQDVLDSVVFTAYCNDADDIWLNISTFLNGRNVYYTGFGMYFLDVMNFNSLPLHVKNLQGGNNDKVIREIRGFYINKNGVDVFDRERIPI